MEHSCFYDSVNFGRKKCVFYDRMGKNMDVCDYFVLNNPVQCEDGSEYCDWYFVDSFLVTKIIFRVIVYMSLLSAEEIMMCFVSNIIWPEQKDTFLNEVREEEDGSI